MRYCLKIGFSECPVMGMASTPDLNQLEYASNKAVPEWPAAEVTTTV
jgi:hypothetical protein